MATTYTLEEAEVLRETAFRAYQKALNSKSSELGRGRRVERQDVTALREEFLHWDQEVARLMGRGSSIVVKTGVPLRQERGFAGWLGY